MITTEEEIAERMRALIHDHLEMEPTDFAEAASLSRQTVKNILDGKAKPAANTLSAILTRWPGLSVAWLLNGTGEAFPHGTGGETPSADAELWMSRAIVAKAEAEMFEKQTQAQAALIVELKKQLARGKSEGNADQPVDTAPKTPRGPKAATRHLPMGFHPQFLLRAQRTGLRAAQGGR